MRMLCALAGRRSIQKPCTLASGMDSHHTDQHILTTVAHPHLLRLSVSVSIIIS